MTMDSFALDLAEEAFDRCVVTAVPYIAHAADDVMILQKLLVLGVGELRSPI